MFGLSLPLDPLHAPRPCIKNSPTLPSTDHQDVPQSKHSDLRLVLSCLALASCNLTSWRALAFTFPFSSLRLFSISKIDFAAMLNVAIIVSCIRSGIYDVEGTVRLVKPPGQRFNTFSKQWYSVACA